MNALCPALCCTALSCFCFFRRLRVISLFCAQEESNDVHMSLLMGTQAETEAEILS